MSYQYILFDWDGCLAQTLEVWLNAYRSTYAMLGIKKTDEEIYQVAHSWKNADDLGIPDTSFIKFRNHLFKTVGKDMLKVELYDGAMDLILNLKSKGKKLGLITSSDRDILEIALKKHKMEPLFDFVLSGEEVSNFKPHPEAIHKALEALDGKKAESVIVGDSGSDLGAALNAGIDSVLFYPDTHKAFYDLEYLKKYKPTHIVKSFAELSKILK